VSYSKHSRKATRQIIMISLFTPTCATSKLSKKFLLLLNHAGYLPAKNEISETISHHPNLDSNFIEQFQSKNGFNARIWELYLLAFFLNRGYGVNCDDDSPDFFISNRKIQIAVEAVTTNPGKEKKIFIKNDDEHQNFLSIKFGSSLYSKLQKKYWKNSNICGLPLVFAIAPFHSEDSFFDSDIPLIKYLYGIDYFSHYNAQKHLVTESKQKKSHQYKGKQIPSGFFNLPESENISAVLFSNSGTVSKFNRMGYLKKPELYPNLTMLRFGCAYSHLANASKPEIFSYTIGDPSFPETWEQGIHLFHNPNAKHPLDNDFFRDIAQSSLKETSLISNVPSFFPYVSQTIILHHKK
jgi:hypothetical protein